MPTTNSSSSRRRRRRRRRRKPLLPPRTILLNNEGYIGSRPNATTAVGEGRNNLKFEASICPAPPPLPSTLFVFCPTLTLTSPRRRPQILAASHDLLLFRVPLAAAAAAAEPWSSSKDDDCDYFVYRAAAAAAAAAGVTSSSRPRPPSLTLLPNPNGVIFHVVALGLLPRGGDQFTVAALLAGGAALSDDDEYELRRFDSEGGRWSSRSVKMDAATRRPFPVKIPVNARRLNHHITTTVITLGGDAGTVGWVDLWSGILLYDLLLLPDDADDHHHQDHAADERRRRRPMVRHMPVPLPMHAITCNRGFGATLGCPRAHRGITVATTTKKTTTATFLRFADLQTIGGRVPYTDVETGMPACEVDDWIVTTWSNTAMGGSFEDWHEEFVVRGSEIKISDAVRAELLSSGLLHRKPMRGDGEEPAVVELALQNLWVSEPTPSQNGDEDVLYLMARTKRLLPKAWALSIDMRHGTLLGVAEFGTESGWDECVTFRQSTVSCI